jgi:hypothetical protein
MATVRQRETAKQNIKKAQARWRTMTSRQRSLAQPEGRTRKKPGSTGQGDYYHIEVRPKGEFVTFRNQDVGKRGHIQRLAGKRSSGSWATVKWLIGKGDAHIRNGRLIPDTESAREVLEQLSSTPAHVRGDRFEAKPRPNVPERAKPTPAQRRARRENIKKAQAARHGR